MLSGTVRGAGASFIPMVISISHLCILRIILLAIIVPLWNSVQAIAIVYPITWAATAFSLFIYYKCFRWRNTAITVHVINLFLWNKNKESDCFDSRIFDIKTDKFNFI